ncbi:type I restriction endonuclease [Candidatus Binatus sp.]|uniref:type I restriction endonuclease n=1 Tax=Candidatus Binatus sp. TaxID=2811406 RepID=UPI002F926575
MPLTEQSYRQYSEQDTADKLILPYLHNHKGFPSPDTLDYQAQHTVPVGEGEQGRYDGLYLSEGYPYAVLEAKRYSHDLTEEDVNQARSYAVSDFFETPVSFIVISNGRERRFLRKTETIDVQDGRLKYAPIPECTWNAVTAEPPGAIRTSLDAAALVQILIDFKNQTVSDLTAVFLDSASGNYDPSRAPSLAPYLIRIIEERKRFIGGTGSDQKKQTRIALQAISLHFTTKILFIKVIEDLSAGSGTPRIIHTLFPRPEYDLLGGLFGFKVLNALNRRGATAALRTFARSRKFYRGLSQDLAAVTWQDIFRYGFAFHAGQYGQLFRADNYDHFLPAESSLAQIRDRLIKIDIRSALIYGDWPAPQFPANHK